MQINIILFKAIQQVAKMKNKNLDNQFLRIMNNKLINKTKNICKKWLNPS